MSKSDDKSEGAKILSHLHRMGVRERWTHEALIDLDLRRLENGLQKDKETVFESLRIVIGKLKREERKELRGELLRAAAEGGHVKSTKAFLDAEFSPDLPGEAGETPLHVAAREGNEEVVELLLSAGATLNATAGTHDRTPLHRATRNNHEEVVRQLLGDGADTEMTDRKGDTPLHLAAREGAHQVAQALTEAGAEAEAVNSNGRRPLHEAARTGNAQVATLLIQAGAETDVGDREGRTPLHMTVTADAGDVAEALIQAGADRHRSDARGETPLQRAQALGADRVVQVFSDAT